MDDNLDERTSIKNEKDPTKKVKLKGITDKQKSMFQAIGSGFGGIALGGALMAMMGLKSNDDESDNLPSNIINRKGGENDYEVPIYGEAPFSDVVNDDMSFSEAFATARKDKGPAAFFEWKGETYNTYYKEEWDALTPEEQQDFYKSVDPNYADSDIVSEEEILEILNDDELDIDEVFDNEDIVIIDDELDIDDPEPDVDDPNAGGDIVVIEDDESDDEYIDDEIDIDDLG